MSELLTSKTESLHEKIATEVVQNVCELPDYNSPDDQPELVMCTVTELHNCVMRALEGSVPETSEDSTDAIRYRFLRDRLVAQGPITYYHMPRALMFLRDETRGTFDTAVDARMKGVEHEPPETEARLPVEVQLQTEKELHAAWRKRAEEAEAALELIRNPPAVDSHGKCRHCGYYNMHGLGCQAADSAVKTNEPHSGGEPS